MDQSWRFVPAFSIRSHFNDHDVRSELRADTHGAEAFGLPDRRLDMPRLVSKLRPVAHPWARCRRAAALDLPGSALRRPGLVSVGFDATGAVKEVFVTCQHQSNTLDAVLDDAAIRPTCLAVRR